MALLEIAVGIRHWPAVHGGSPRFLIHGDSRFRVG